MDHGRRIRPRNVWYSTVNTTSWWHRELGQLQQASFRLQIGLDLSYWKIPVICGFLLCRPASHMCCTIDLITFCFVLFLVLVITLHGVDQSWLRLVTRVCYLSGLWVSMQLHITPPVFQLDDRWYVGHAVCVNSVACLLYFI